MEDVMATTAQKQMIDRPAEGAWQVLCGMSDQLSEWFWFMLSFLLFVVLGPFSAPIALIAIFKLGIQENEHREPDLEVQK